MVKHSTAEFQSIQQFWLQLDIVSKQNKKTKNAETRNWRIFAGSYTTVIIENIFLQSILVKLVALHGEEDK